MKSLTQLKDLLVQFDILHTGRTPLLLQGLHLVHKLCTVLLGVVHVAHQSFPVSFQLSHLQSQHINFCRFNSEKRTLSSAA